MGRSPRVIPLHISAPDSMVEDICAVDIIEHLQLDIKEAQDNLLQAKISQSIAANEH